MEKKSQNIPLQELKSYVVDMVRKDIQMSDSIGHKSKTLEGFYRQIESFEKELSDANSKQKCVKADHSNLSNLVRSLQAKQLVVDTAKSHAKESLLKNRKALDFERKKFLGLRESIKSEKEKLKTVTQEKIDLQVKVDELKDSIKKNESQMERLNQMLKASVAEHQKQKAKKRHLVHRSEELEQENKVIEETSNEIRMQTEHLQQRQKALEALIKIKKESFEMMQRMSTEELERAESSLAQVTAEAEKAKRQTELKMKKRLTSLKEKENRLQEDENVMEMSIEDLTTKLIEQEIATDAANKKARVMEYMEETYSKRITEMDTKIADCQSELDALDITPFAKKVQDLKSKLNRIMSENSIEKKKEEDLKKQLSSLSSQVSALRAQISGELSAKEKACKDNLSKIAAEQEKANAKLKDLSTKESKLQRSMEKVKLEENIMQTRLLFLKKTWSQMQDKWINEKSQVSKMENRKKFLDAEIESRAALRNKVQDITKRNAKAIDEAEMRIKKKEKNLLDMDVRLKKELMAKENSLRKRLESDFKA